MLPSSKSHNIQALPTDERRRNSVTLPLPLYKSDSAPLESPSSRFFPLTPKFFKKSVSLDNPPVSAYLASPARLFSTPQKRESLNQTLFETPLSNNTGLFTPSPQSDPFKSSGIKAFATDNQSKNDTPVTEKSGWFSNVRLLNLCLSSFIAFF